ncbi:MAG: uncharacterized protein JWM16_6228, partial [Verrucomicrobiales bacterium]|nr:uncharacterized protein [Verrucomicrobiales bacterium]
HTIQADISLVGKTISPVSTVTLVGDATIPALVSVKADGTLQKVFIQFNKPLNAVESGIEKFALFDNNAQEIERDGLTVDATGSLFTLHTLAPMPDGAVITLQLSDLIDACSNPLAANPTITTFTTPKILPGMVTFETYGNPGTAGGIGGNNVNNLIADPRYPNSPRETLFIGGLDTRLGYPDDSHEAYGGRMSGYFTPTATDNYVFYTKGDDGQRFRMNTNDVDSANAAGAVTLMDTGDACCQAYSAHGSPTVHLNGGQRYYFEALWKEGGGGDFQQIAFKTVSDSASPDGLSPIGCAYLSTTVDSSVLATRPGAPKILPTTGKMPLGSLTSRGFQVHFVQIATNIDPITANSERLLACQAGPNVAGLPRFTSQKLNYNITGQGSIGRLQPDDIFPGTPGRIGVNYNDNMALEALTYLELQPGLYTLDVNSDDGFRVSPATSVGDANNSITLGEFSGGRGSSDSLFQIIVTEAGLYPFRLTWIQGGGGANLEFMSVAQCPTTAFTAINDDTGIKAYLPPTTPVITDPPVIVSCPTNRVIAITNGCTAVIPDLMAEFFAADCNSVVSVGQSPAAGTVVGPGNQVVTFSATNSANLRSSCTVTLTFVDRVAPVITTCAPNKSVAAGNDCLGIVPDMTAGLVANDGCPGALTVTQSPLAGTSIPSGPQPVTITVADAAGNTATCVATLNVVPPGPTPVISFQVVGPNLQISWTSPASCWKLQGSAALVPPAWTTIEGHSPVSVPLSSGLGFFRLIAAPNP